jgi:hypothetical protein
MSTLRLRTMSWKGMVLVIGLAAMIPARAGQATADQATDRASERAAALILRGFNCRDRIKLERLDQGDYFVINTILYGQNHYVFVGAGDNGISDLDLALYDEDGNLVVKDTDIDAVPVVEANVRATTSATLKVIAYRGSGWATAIICYE